MSDFEIDCENVMNLAKELSNLGEEIGQLFEKANYSLGNLGEAKRWGGNNYNTIVTQINKFYLSNMNDIIRKTVVTIPEAIIKGINNYQKADGNNIYNVSLYSSRLLQELQITPSGTIIFYESDINEGLQVYKSSLNNVLDLLEVYKEKFNNIENISWIGFAMTEYKKMINKISLNAEEITEDMNRSISYNIERVIEKLNAAEKSDMATVTGDGGILTPENAIDVNVNTDFYENHILGKTNGSLADVAKLTKEQLMNNNKNTDIYDMDKSHNISQLDKESTRDCSSYVGFVLYNYFVANGMYDKLEILKDHRKNAGGSDAGSYGSITAAQYRNLENYDNGKTLKDLGFEEIDYVDDSQLREGDIIVSNSHVEIYAKDDMVYSYGGDDDQYSVLSKKDILAKNDSKYNEKYQTKILRVKDTITNTDSN